MSIIDSHSVTSIYSRFISYMVQPNPMSKTQTLLVFGVSAAVAIFFGYRSAHYADKNNNQPKLTDKQISVEKGDLQ